MNKCFEISLAAIQNGFFVEAGAKDCEDQSVSLPFELNHNWTGKAKGFFKYITRIQIF
jgi:hypothetical protein